MIHVLFKLIITDEDTFTLVLKMEIFYVYPLNICILCHYSITFFLRIMLEIKIQNAVLDFPCGQENLCLYGWTTPNMITLLASSLVRGHGWFCGLPQCQSWCQLRVLTEPHHGHFEHTGQACYFEKSPRNEDCVGLQNVL